MRMRREFESASFIIRDSLDLRDRLGRNAIFLCKERKACGVSWVWRYCAH